MNHVLKIHVLSALLKEVRESPLEMIKCQKFDGERMALYPNLDYKQLFNALTQLMDVVSFVHVGLAGELNFDRITFDNT